MTGRNWRARPDLELRVMVDGQVVIGPIQAALLEAILAAGSIAAAQRRIGASFAHVWKLVAAMNEAFASPLVEPIRGGARGGDAMLTEQGHKVLDFVPAARGSVQDPGARGTTACHQPGGQPRCSQASMRKAHWRHLSWQSTNHARLIYCRPATG